MAKINDEWVRMLAGLAVAAIAWYSATYVVPLDGRIDETNERVSKAEGRIEHIGSEVLRLRDMLDEVRTKTIPDLRANQARSK